MATSIPIAIAFDGTDIWATNQSGCVVMKFRTSDGTKLGTFDVGTSARDIIFDGTYIWVTNSSSNTVMKMKGTDPNFILKGNE